MIQTRLTDRPLYSQFRVSLTKKSWADTEADFALAIHGNDCLDIETNERNLIVNPVTKVNHYFDLRWKTNGRLPPFLRLVLERGMGLGYEYVGVFDDDAYYTRPEESAHDIVTAFESEPNAAALGPMGNFRKFRRFDNNPDFMEPLYRCPWATLGSQIYRTEYLRKLDLSFLDRLQFRADAILSLLLYGRGYGNYEMDLPFNHTVSAGLNQKAPSADFHRSRLRQVDHDYLIYQDVLYKQVYPINPILYKELVYTEIPKLQNAERKHNEKKLAAILAA